METKMETKKEDRYRIILIAKKDSCYVNRANFIGKEGTMEVWTEKPGNWVSCRFTFDDPLGISTMFFYKVLLKKLGKRKILVE